MHHCVHKNKGIFGGPGITLPTSTMKLDQVSVFSFVLLCWFVYPLNISLQDFYLFCESLEVILMNESALGDINLPQFATHTQLNSLWNCENRLLA